MKSAVSGAVLKLKENRTIQPKLVISLPRIPIVYEPGHH